MKRLIIVGLILGLPALALAGHCPNVRARAVVVQAVQYAQPAYYQVGQDLQSDALAERVAAKVLARLEAKLGTGTPPAPDTAPALSLVVQNCAQCHSGATPKGDLDLTTGVDGMPCEQRLLAIKMLVNEDESARMPKGHPLDPQVLGDLIGIFAGAKAE